MGKKPNPRKPRPKKPRNRAIDLKLQNLLLDIELESSASQKASLSMDRNAVTKVDQMNQNLLPSVESVANIEKNPTSDCYIINSSIAAAEVIDLLSPSLPVHSRMVSKCQQANVECIEMSEFE